VADAQTQQFLPERFDVCISRFGSMFFTDPEVAFGNLARALRPGGRPVLLVWQAPEHNAWAGALQAAVSPGAAAPAWPPGSDPFSLADPEALERLLTNAGLAGVAFEDVRDPISYGPDPATALDLVSGFAAVREKLDELEAESDDAAGAAKQRLLDLLTAHDTGKGVYFDARAWIVTAHR
jgi:SAM-dependent methyltransferase